MTYRVTLSPMAARQLRKLDAQVRRRIQAALELLAEPPGHPLRPGSSEAQVSGESAPATTGSCTTSRTNDC
jgi:mRNA interferase RelE/StbE